MNFHSKSLVVLALAVSFAGCATSSRTLSKSERIEKLLDIAAAAIAENDPVSGLETLNQVRELDDSIPREHYLYSLAYLAKKETILAEKSAREALQLDPKFTSAKNTLGKILMDEGRLSEAEPLFKEAANDILFRDSPLAKTNLGILYFKKMDMKSSERWLLKAIEDKGPLTCVAEFHLGKVNLEQGELTKAARNFRNASRGACSGISEVHLAMGQTMLRQKKYDEARAKFVEIQRLFPNSEASDRASESLRGIP